MIRTASDPFRSKRIHIGMDEAYGLSEGRFRTIFGQKDPTDVFIDHIRRVNDICTRLGVSPMIWADSMFPVGQQTPKSALTLTVFSKVLFCLQAKNQSLQGYYDGPNPATPQFVQSIPDEIELV